MEFSIEPSTFNISLHFFPSLALFFLSAQRILVNIYDIYVILCTKTAIIYVYLTIFQLFQVVFVAVSLRFAYANDLCSKWLDLGVNNTYNIQIL